MMASVFHVGQEYHRFPNQRAALRGPDEARVFWDLHAQGISVDGVFSGDPIEEYGVGTTLMMMLLRLRYDHKYPSIGPTWNADRTYTPESKYSINGTFRFWEVIYVGLTHTHMEFYLSQNNPRSTSQNEWLILSKRGRGAFDEVRRPLVAALKETGYQSNLVSFS